MSRIVAVVASPREEGNSNAIVDAILEGAMGLSTNIIDLYSLDGLRLVHGCRGCRVCKTSGRCAQDDEISDVLEAIRGADCTVFSTPVYFAAESAQFKVLEDRMFSFIGADGKSNLEAGKRAILVVTCSGPEDAAAAATVERLSAIIPRLGFDLTDTIVFSDAGGTRRAADDAGLMARAKAVGLTMRNT